MAWWSSNGVPAWPVGRLMEPVEGFMATATTMSSVRGRVRTTRWHNPYNVMLILLHHYAVAQCCHKINLVERRSRPLSGNGKLLYPSHPFQQPRSPLCSTGVTLAPPFATELVVALLDGFPLGAVIVVAECLQQSPKGLVEALPRPGVPGLGLRWVRAVSSIRGR